MEYVAKPAKIGVSSGWCAELPTRVVAQAITTPVGDIERGVGEDEIRLQVFMFIAMERAFVVPANVGLDASDRHVHLGELPGRVVHFLAIDRDVADLTAMGQDEFLGLNEHAAGSAAGIIDSAVKGFEHGDEQADDGWRRVKLAAALSFGAGEATEEIFVNATQDVLGVCGVGRLDRSDEIDELTEHRLVERRSAVVLRQDALEAFIRGFDSDHGGVDDLSDRVGFRGCLNG